MVEQISSTVILCIYYLFSQSSYYLLVQKYVWSSVYYWWVISTLGCFLRISINVIQKTRNMYSLLHLLQKKQTSLREKEKIKHINIINVQHVSRLFVYQKDAERLKSAVQSVILSLSKELRGTNYVEGITYSSFRWFKYWTY